MNDSFPPKSDQSNSVDLSVVVPVYKEAANIRPFLQRTEEVMAKMGACYEIIFALDPSPDETEAIILEEINRNPAVKLILFSRRFGQPAATMAGILNCTGEKCVVIDVDLQDQPEIIEQLYNKMAEGYEVVYAMRASREGETFIKRAVSYFGYSVINRLSDVQIPRNTGDFRIMSRRVIEELRRMSETHGFLRGMVAYVGFKQAAVIYNRDARLTGTGNYNRLIGSLRIGLNGLVGFSSRPLQVMSMGVLGEYIGRIYDETKRRPMYIVDRKVNFADSVDRSTDHAGAGAARQAE